MCRETRRFKGRAGTGSGSLSAHCSAAMTNNETAAHSRAVPDGVEEVKQDDLRGGAAADGGAGLPRPRAEYLFIGWTVEISDLAFKRAAGMIEIDPVLSAKFLVQPRQEDHVPLKWRILEGQELFTPTVVTGSKPSGVLIDEIHVIGEMNNADRVVGQLRGGLISQPEAFLVNITTQSERPPAGVFAAELMKARKVRDGELRAPSCRFCMSSAGYGLARPVKVVDGHA